MFKNLIYCFLIVMLVVSCKGRHDNNPEAAFEFGDTVDLKFQTELEKEVMEDIISNLASPVEVAALINQIGAPFSKDYLASTAYLDNYNTTFEKAYALGAFGTDLGYLNMYNKNNIVLNYLQAVSSLAEDLKIGQFFDFTLLKRLATSSSNLDSLMYLSVRSFNQMDRYLRENKRSHISSLIIAGLWLEGLYLAGQVARDHPNEEINNRIGEQKIIINDLIAILNNYKSDKKFAALISDVENLKSAFDNVKITIETGEPEMREENGMLVLVQHEKSIVEITPETLQHIIANIEALRNKLITI